MGILANVARPRSRAARALAVVALVSAAAACDQCDAFPLACASSADCADDAACDTVAGVCVAGAREGEGDAVAEGEGDAVAEGEGDAVAEGEGGASAEGEGAAEGEGGNAGEGEGGAEGEGAGEGEGACGDADGDGFGVGCANGVDNDDDDGRVSPGRFDECDGIDNDGDGVIDNGEVCGCIRIDVADDKGPRLLCLDARSFDDANVQCALRGYRLAIFQSVAENDAIKPQLGGLQVWIALARLADGTFSWLDGTPLSFDDFNAGEPNDFNGTEDCVQFRGDGWNDDTCGNRTAYLCEPAPAAPQLPGGNCTDLDHDGRGFGCPRGDDCDDTDPTAFALVGGVIDGDGDGVTSNVRALRCTDASQPADLALAPSTVPDCDDTDSSVIAGCDHNCISVANDQGPISFCDDSVPEANAEQNCLDQFGIDLVSVHDEDTELVIAQLTGASRDAWIGLDDQAVEFQFEFADGTSLGTDEFSAFRARQPDDIGGTERCVELTAGGWNDEPCTNDHPYVCR